ncbi:MAG: 30S ribosomal protein S4 [Candidatus Helarchaeota archaeon]
MGDPKKSKKKYSKPSHPWEAERLHEELILVGTYGLRNKRELWRHQTMLRKYRRRARDIRIMPKEKQEKETEILIKKLHRIGVLPENATIDDVLQLTVSDILERRLQTVVFRKGLAKTPYQARQFIVHGHIAISGKRILIPSYIVTIDEEPEITYSPTSPLAKNPNHPERQKGVVS